MSELGTTTIFANAVSFTEDGYSTVLAFADDPIKSVNYIMLDMINEPDDQDLKLGQGGVHMEAGALHVDGYDLIQDIREYGSGVIIRLTQEAAQKWGLGREIEIELKVAIVDGVPIGDAIQRFKNRLLGSRS